MCKQTDYEDRKALIHLLNSGETPREEMQELGRSVSLRGTYNGLSAAKE